MKIGKLKSIAVGTVFIIILLAVVDFRIASIIDIKVFSSMLLGVILLTKASYKDKNADVERLVVYHAVITSIFASTLMYLDMLSTGTERSITLPIQPILYGILIYIGFLVIRVKVRSDIQEDTSTETSTPENQPVKKSTLYSLGLSDREISIALEILKKKTNKEIASDFFIAESTVKKHVQNIFRKAEVSTRQELCILIETGVRPDKIGDGIL